MSRINRPDPSVSKETSTELEVDEESLGVFFPILLGAAAICLLMFFFITPSFKDPELVPAKSVPPAVIDRW